MVIAFTAAVTIASVQTNSVRQRAIQELAPEQMYTRSFVDSLRNAPDEFQSFLHAGALKNCTPYAWSYSEMEFYQMPANVAVNVLPQNWIDECRIVRTQH